MSQCGSSTQGHDPTNDPVMIKSENVKRTTKRRARRVASDEEDDVDDNARDEERIQDAPQDDSTADGESEHEEGSPKGQKRSRTNARGDSVKTETRNNTQSDSDEEADEERPIINRPKALIRGDDGYVVGSILRVKLYNFLTYEGPVEFFPGPYLNLILGPNGTGKSSIACAIAIGLGWPPKILGRADNLNQFVKTGADNGWTEIELKGRLRERNPIIRREINVKNRASNWLLNGKQVPMKDINAKVKSLNIQIENLCSFMPQDKVSEFAKMTPQQLLIQTQRAAGDEHLTEWHTELIELGAELAKHLTEMEGEATQLKRLEDKNRELEREVARWREKQLIEQEVALWEIIVPVVEYTDLKNQYLIHKEKVGEAARKFQELQDRNDPMNELQERIAAKVKELESQRKRETDRSTKKFNDLQRKQAECEDTTSESLFTELGELKKEEKERKAKIVRLKKHIADLEEKVAKPPEVENLEDIEEEATKLRDEQRTLRDEQDIFMQKINEHVEVTGRLKAGLAHHERELADLDNVAKRRLDALRRVDADCAATIEWLRKPENRRRFKMEVTEPAIVSLDVPDLRYVDQVEACISFQQAKTFVCACEEDYKLLGRLVNDTDEALGRRGRITVWFRPKDESRLNGPSLSEEQLREFGFDGYATDFVNAPEGLMWYLKKELNMHRTAVARTPNVRVKETIDKISAGPGGNFIAGNLLYRVSRSAYGKNLAQTSTSNIGSARNFKFDAVDPATKQNIEAQIASKTEELQRQEAGNEQITREQKALGEKVAACNKRQDEVKRRKDRRKKILQEHEGLKLKITMEEQRLKTEEDRPGIETKVAKIKKQIADVGEKRGKLVMQVTSLAQELLHMQQAATLTNLKLAQVKSNQVALERLGLTYNTALTRAHQAWEAEMAIFERIKVQSKEKLTVVREKMDRAEDVVRQEYEQMKNGAGLPKDVEMAREELEARRAKLDSIVVNNPGAVAEYEERERKIVSLQGSLEKKRKTEENTKRRMAKTRAKWYPALRDLVDGIGEKFSAAFDDIGCAGEVRIGEHESYDKWTIDIHVKFRDDEEFQLLTGQRQSGGERSLTTIMYLMSMMEYSRCPFSLVDEINQGMDARAERVVQNRLTRVTCKKDAGQYFLLTPKLLPNLDYHKRMKVLTVFNGEWLPEPETGNYGSLKRMIMAHKEKQQKALAAS